MKIKGYISQTLVVFFCAALLILVIPFCLLFLLFKLLTTPIDYIKYKRSRYQQDFPHKYKWLDEPHTDNAPYTVIKENSLPVEYIKWREDYDLLGYFVYKDIMLVFYEPLFFDKEEGLWLWSPDEESNDETAESDETEESANEDTADDYLTVEDLRAFLLDEFHSNVSNRECSRVVFFYAKKKVEKHYGESALKKMLELEDFIVYEKGRLAEAIKNFTDTY